jgi:voltage-gated potassium channel
MARAGQGAGAMERLNRYTDTFKELAALYAALILVGAAVFAWAEAKPFDDALWWAFVTAMTVGYGDIAPVTALGRICAVVLMHAVPLFIAPIIVTRLVTRIMDDRDKFSHEEQELLKKELREIKSLLAAQRPGNAT